MKILFVDESGDPGEPIYPSSTKYFIIGGPIVNERDWLKLKEGLVQVKKKHKIDPTREIKWGHLRSPKRDNPLLHLSFKERIELALDLLGRIAECEDIKVVIVAVKKADLYRKRKDGFGPTNLYYESYSVLMERFEYFLKQAKDLGMVIHDFTSTSQGNERLRDLAENIVNKGTHWTKIKHLCEGFLFVPSHKSVGIQYADFIAGAVSRFKNANDKKYLDVIWNNFLRNPKGQVWGAGIKTFPK